MKKIFIPHKCKYCNCELWYKKNSEKNFRFQNNKTNYWYECTTCKKRKLKQ